MDELDKLMNHLSTLQKAYDSLDRRVDQIEQCLAAIKSDLSWLKKITWCILAAIIGVAISLLF